MGSILSIFSGPPKMAAPELPPMPAPAPEQELGSAEERRKRAEERRRAMARMAGSGLSSTVQTTPLGSTARPEVARTGLAAEDRAAAAVAQPRKTTLG